MRKRAAVLMLVALMLPVGLMGAAPAGAVGGTKCKAVSGTATFKPALPKFTSTKQVTPSVTAKGAQIGGCVGGGVKSAGATLTAKFSKPGNCVTLAKGTANPVRGKLSLTWNTKQISTIGAVLLTGIPNTATQLRIAGKVTAGLFKGSALSGTVNYTPQGGGCTKVNLAKVTLKQITSLVIK
jgi:hypothetical protein